MDSGLLFDQALLTGLINQSLLLKLCPHCKTPVEQNYERLASYLVQRVQHLT